MLTKNRRPKKMSLQGIGKLQGAKARSRGYAQKLAPKTKELTGSILVEAMQEARRLGLKVRPLRTYPPMRSPVTFED
jgi:hypothetical protein